MSLQAIEFKDTYWSGENQLIDDFYIPCLEESVEYCRAVGFFSSSILCYISNGLYPFIKNGGRMRIVCSVNVSEDDAREIELGYSIKELMQQRINQEIEKFLNLNIVNVKNLCWLIKNNRLDIKVCLRQNQERPNQYKLFHEKFGIFKDADGNVVSFLGSINETLSGWINNEESFEVSQSWNPSLEKRVNEKQLRFEKLWSGSAPNIITCEFPDAARKKMIQHAPAEPIDYTVRDNGREIVGFKPRHCQEAAKEKFVSSDFNCLFMMATGAGKTKAALYAMNQIENWRMLLICVPNIELVEQWEKDVMTFFPTAYLIKCSTINPQWKDLLLALIQAKIPRRTIIISTYDSAIKDFSMDKWMSVKSEKLAMICDEVHNIGAPTTQRIMNLCPRYSIGLSATPERNFDEEGSQKILDYYHNNKYEFSIRDAQRAKYLVEYDYQIIPCPMNELDWESYLNLTQRISQIKQALNRDKIKPEVKRKYEQELEKLYRERSKILKKNGNKENYFAEIFHKLPENARVLIYGDDLEQLNEFKPSLDKLGKHYFEYTGDKDPNKMRPVMLKEFRQGIRKILLAVGCLDEGIDIPACDAAIFVSSSTSERQFIQRRGRVLRTAQGKEKAWIFDYLVYPELSSNVADEELRIARSMVESQYKRINIIAEDAVNGLQERKLLDAFLSAHKLNPYEY